MSDKIYLIFLGIYTLIIIANYNLLKNPNPTHQSKLGKNLKEG